MKTIRKMLCAATTLPLLVMLALTGIGWAQPTVTVPGFCNVVVAGTGGVVGFGGIVGSGGIVVMPDPSPTGAFNVNPMGNTILAWSLAGDLSVGPIVQPSPPVQFLPAGTLSATIVSYNKLVRISESTPPSADYLARSKGRVSISYTNISATCGGSIQFDVYKEYINSGWPSSGTQDGYVPPIIGPDCFEPSTTYTYSVDQIASDNYGDGIGGDEYYWTIPSSLGAFYNSADKSSITFTTPGTLTAANYTLQCCYGRANPWDANSATPTTCVTKVIGIQPGLPGFITAPPACVPTTSGASFTISINPPSASYSYAWTASNATWILTPSGSQNQNLTVSSLGNDPGIITLTVTNGSCNPSIFTYTVNREFTAPVVISSTGSCVAAGSVNNYQLSSGLQNPSTWTVPAGWTYTNANGAGSSINLTVPAGTPAGAYVISVASTACPLGVLNYTVNVRPATPAISGPACVTRNGGSPVLYTSTSSPGATGYNWTFPSGWTCIANCATTSPVVQPGGTAITPQNITVTAVGTNGCNAVSSPFVVNYSPVTPNSITTGCFSFGVAGSTTVTVANRPLPFYGSYTITSTPAGLITSYSVNPSGIITISTSGSAPAGSYTLNITHTTTSCGNSAVVSFPITYGGNGAMVTPVYNPGVGNSDVYIISGAPVGSTYQWYVDGNPVPAGSGGTASVLVLSGNGTPPTTIYVDVTNGGCTTRIFTTPGTHSLLPEHQPDGEMEMLLAQVQVYPNPNDGNFVIKVPAFEREASLQIVDPNGKEIGTHTLKQGENRIVERDLVPGLYFLILKMDGNYSSHKLQVSQK